jgi:hypothetical protein
MGEEKLAGLPLGPGQGGLGWAGKKYTTVLFLGTNDKRGMSKRGFRP